MDPRPEKPVEEPPLVERDQRRVEELSTRIAQAFINAMEAKSPYLRGHSERVAVMAASIASELGLDDDTVEQVRLAGRLHDVGKIGIREDVLNKPGPLTPEEYAHVRDHVRIGMDILAPLAHLGPVLDYVRDHQERRDGSGHPRSLRGDEISLGALIVGAADVFDAITSPRAYRGRRGPRETIEYLERLDKPAVDPQILPALKRIVHSGRALVFLDEPSNA
jgi:HD-GYP domain-containing protein (c-di-GMP phosphodiesterase class II)